MNKIISIAFYAAFSFYALLSGLYAVGELMELVANTDYGQHMILAMVYLILANIYGEKK